MKVKAIRDFLNGISDIMTDSGSNWEEEYFQALDELTSLEDESGILRVYDNHTKDNINEREFSDKDDLIEMLLAFLNDAFITYRVDYSYKHEKAKQDIP